MPKAPVNGIDLYYESHGSDSALRWTRKFGQVVK